MTHKRENDQNRPWTMDRKRGTGKLLNELAWKIAKERKKRNIADLAERDKRSISQSVLWAEWKGIKKVSDIPWYAMPCKDSIETQKDFFDKMEA